MVRGAITFQPSNGTVTGAGADAATFGCSSLSRLRLAIFALMTPKAFVPSTRPSFRSETSNILYFLQNMTGYPH
jgi:hypothetical protein